MNFCRKGKKGERGCDCEFLQKGERRRGKAAVLKGRGREAHY